MKIYNQKDVEILDIEVGDNSFRYRSIMKDDSVTLYYSLTNHVEIPVGSYIILPGNQRYTLYKPENFSKKGTRNFEYTVIFNGEQELLKKYKYKFITRYPEVKNSGSEEPAVEKKIKTYQLAFPMTAKPMVFLQLMVDNLNLYNPAGIENKYIWKVGDCVVDTEKALSFNHEYCYDVLNRLASEFNTEWEIENRTIHLRKVEKNKQNPLPLSYGKGNGFKTGIGRQTQGDKPPVTRLYVQGGERNIYEKDYGCKTLLLPLDKELVYEGRRYRTDTEGTYIYRSDIEVADINEDSLDASHIYPKWEGTVSELLELNAEKNICKFKIVEPAKQPDFTNARMPDEKATIIFQSGRLTGLEFNLTQDKDTITGYDHTEGSFEIEIQENGGVKMPNETLRIEPGDRFAVFHIKLPPEYICDDKNQKGGSWDMFREAARYMYEHEEEQFSFTGELDGIWAKKDWLKIGGKILPGGYVQFSDSQFQPEGILIRITGVKDFINNPHSPEIELSNIPVEGFVSNDLGKIDSNEVTVETNHKNSIEYTKRRWRDAQETISMLENAIDGFSEGIKPIWVQAMSVLVGDERLQFKFVNTNNTNLTVEPNYHYDQGRKQLKVSYPSNTSLLHLTLGGKNMSPSHDTTNYRSWNMNGTEYLSPVLDNPNPLYLYARCDRSTSNPTGQFELTERAYKMDEGSYYYFLVGTLSSEYEGERSFTTVYGFTEILPGRMTVDKIASTDGVQYWDMANKAFKIGDNNSYLGYNINQDGKLVLKGTLVQSPSGETTPIGVFVGAWDSARTYYVGDEVTYSGSTYRCKIQHRSVNPTNTSYWTVVAQKGTDGKQGPAGSNGKDGSQGPQGSVGPAMTFRGTWQKSTEYFKDQYRVDVVREGSNYYYRIGSRYKVVSHPTTKEDWQPYGGSFSSVATGLLLAETATIAGWNFSQNFIYSKDSRCVLDGYGGYDPNNETPVIAVGNSAFSNSVVNKKAALKLYAGGTLTVGTGEVSSNAGITGHDNNPLGVRFWAGDTFTNRYSAKFRVLQNGRVYATDGIFSGEISAKKLTVEDIRGWNVPGIVGIYHLGYAEGMIYNSGKFTVQGVTRSSEGHYIVRHNLGHTKYSVMHTGAARHSGTLGFLGTSRAAMISPNSVELQFKDTENKNHDLDRNAQVDLIFISYVQN